MFSLLDKTPNDNTYLAIGSAPHVSLEKYTDKMNQLYPLFIRELGGQWTMIHIDPEFGRPEQQEFADSYFKSMGFIKQGQYRYRSSTVDAILIPEHITDEQRARLLTSMTLKISEVGKKLIVQEYTGHELLPLFDKVIKSLSSEQVNQLNHNILWDITYGNDCSCMTDMTVFKPIQTHAGFFTPACMAESELISHIGKDPRIDQLISTRFKKEYRRLIDVHHVNYRRRVKGLTNYITAQEYGNDATPEEIMKVFSDQMFPVLHILKHVTHISDEKSAQQVDMMMNYHTYDVYKWYSFMCGVYI
jgi:hypothetical protein